MTHACIIDVRLVFDRNDRVRVRIDGERIETPETSNVVSALMFVADKIESETRPTGSNDSP